MNCHGWPRWAKNPVFFPVGPFYTKDLPPCWALAMVQTPPPKNSKPSWPPATFSIWGEPRKKLKACHRPPFQWAPFSQSARGPIGLQEEKQQSKKTGQLAGKKIVLKPSSLRAGFPRIGPCRKPIGLNVTGFSSVIIFTASSRTLGQLDFALHSLGNNLNQLYAGEKQCQK